MRIPYVYLHICIYICVYTPICVYICADMRIYACKCVYLYEYKLFASKMSQNRSQINPGGLPAPSLGRPWLVQQRHCAHFWTSRFSLFWLYRFTIVFYTFWDTFLTPKSTKNVIQKRRILKSVFCKIPARFLPIPEHIFFKKVSFFRSRRSLKMSISSRRNAYFSFFGCRKARLQSSAANNEPRVRFCIDFWVNLGFVWERKSTKKRVKSISFVLFE